MKRILGLVLFISIILTGCATQDAEADKSILKGKLIMYGTEPGHGILLDEEIDIDGNKVKEFFFHDKESVLDFVPREYFTFYFEGRNSIKEELSGEIPMEIKVDLDSFVYDIDRGFGWIDVLEVLSVDGEENPEDKSSNKYPDGYYKDMFNNLMASMGFGATESDIRDTEIYKAGGKIKEAVDELIDRGYTIEKGEDRYNIK